MKSCIRRFPAVAAIIINNLDDQSLVRSKEISKEMGEFIKKERFYWIRIIQKYNHNGRQIIKKAHINNLKEIAGKSEKSYWIKIIKGYEMNFGEHEQAWKEIVDGIPLAVIRQVVIAMKHFSKLHTGLVISFRTP